MPNHKRISEAESSRIEHAKVRVRTKEKNAKVSPVLFSEYSTEHRLKTTWSKPSRPIKARKLRSVNAKKRNPLRRHLKIG
jgi:hypothetical protein